MPAISLSAALTQAGFDHVDWLKVDAQGVDLRLFASLPRPIADAILAVDFEPGIIDAYCGEDKLHDVLRCLETRPFWCSGLEVRGDWRIEAGLLDRSFSPFERRLILRTHPVAPGWAQLQFLNTFQAPGPLGLRETLLGWVFATLVGQHLFAFDLANRGWERFHDPMFPELAQDSRRRLRWAFPKGLAAIALRRIWRLTSVLRRARP